MQAVANEAIAQYPFLTTPTASRIVGWIIKERDTKIAQGMDPASALREAVMAYGPHYAPQFDAPATRAEPQVPSRGEVPTRTTGNHSGFPEQCRWATPSYWTCK